MSSVNLNEINWSDIILQLTAFTQYLINIDKGDWCKGPLNLPKGLQAKDLAMEAIMEFLENSDKFDSKRNESLINYLRFNIVRRLVSNLKKSKENLTTLSSFNEENDSDDIEIFEKYKSNSSREFYELFIIEGIDVDKMIGEIEQEIKNDVEMSMIFNALVYDNSQRHEICADLGINPAQYDNILKRLKRSVDRIRKSKGK
jgi:hypothetical protein